MRKIHVTGLYAPTGYIQFWIYMAIWMTETWEQESSPGFNPIGNSVTDKNKYYF